MFNANKAAFVGGCFQSLILLHLVLLWLFGSAGYDWVTINLSMYVHGNYACALIAVCKCSSDWTEALWSSISHVLWIPRFLLPLQQCDINLPHELQLFGWKPSKSYATTNTAKMWTVVAISAIIYCGAVGTPTNVNSLGCKAALKQVN